MTSYRPRDRAPCRGGRVLFALTLLVPWPAAAQDGRGAAAVASAHPLATAAGQEVLGAGGNAFDAAVAVAAALAVVEPYASGLGGGGFWLLHDAGSGRSVVVDGRETAPRAAHRDLYLDGEGRVAPGRSTDGPLAAAIPGLPAALEHVARRYGRLPLARSLAPSVRLARDGFRVSPHYRRMALLRLQALEDSPAAAALFLADGEVPPEGHRVVQEDLGRTLEALGREGARSFYRGPVAQQLVSGVRAAGGIWSEEDLAGYRVTEREPVAVDYRGWRILSAPPPSSGGVALATSLHVLAGYDLAVADAVLRTHLIVEALRRAFRDRAEHLGDPDFVPVPVALLTHPSYAAGLRVGINPHRATPSAALAPTGAGSTGTHTTHLSVLDREGNRVAATLSINLPFGSGFIVPGTGVLLNNELDDFSASPGAANAYGLVGSEANAIAPGKRPLSSMSPTFAEGPGGVAILGTPGGSRIISTVLLALLDLVEGRVPEVWVSRPRFHHQYLPDEVQYEPGALSAAQASALEAMGHRLRALDAPYGNLQAILWDRAGGRVQAASDPRGEGLAEVR